MSYARWMYTSIFTTYELQRQYLWTCAPSEDSDQAVHWRSLIIIFAGRCLDVSMNVFSRCGSSTLWAWSVGVGGWGMAIALLLKQPSSEGNLPYLSCEEQIHVLDKKRNASAQFVAMSRYTWTNTWSVYTVTSLLMASMRYGHTDYCDKLVIVYFKFLAWRDSSKFKTMYTCPLSLYFTA